MAEPSRTRAARQIMQLGATLLAAAAVGWALGAPWQAVAALVGIAGLFGVAGLVMRRGKERS